MVAINLQLCYTLPSFPFPILEILGIRATNTAKAIATIPMKKKPNPNAIPMEHENHILAAVVKFVTLLSSSLFRISPAPRNPIPVTI